MDLFSIGVQMDTTKVRSGERDLDSWTKTTGKAEREAKKFGEANQQSAGKVNKLSGAVKAATAALAAYVTVDAAAAALRTADSFQLLNDRIRLATDATGDYVSVQRELYALSQSTGTALSGNVDLFQRIQIGASELGRSNSEVLQLVDSLSKLGTLGGSSTDELSNATVQLAQGLAGGVIRAEEFNSILENTPKIAQSIAAGLGVSVGELRQMMLDGELLADDVFNSILSQTTAINEQFDQMPPRIGRAGTALSNAWTNTVGLFDDAIGASSTVAGWMDAIANKLDERVDFWREELGLVEQMEVQVASLASAYNGLGLVQLRAREATLKRMEADLAEQVAGINSVISLPLDDLIRSNYEAVKNELGVVQGQIEAITGKQKEGSDNAKKTVDYAGELIDKYNPLLAQEKQLKEEQLLLNAALESAGQKDIPLILNALEQVRQKLQDIRNENKDPLPLVPSVNGNGSSGMSIFDVGANTSDNFSDVITNKLTPQLADAVGVAFEEGAEEGAKNVPSDFAMSVGNALASQDYSSFGNILASQAASSIGTAVTDAIGGSLGGVAGGLIGGAAGAVIGQAISSYMEDDLIALERQASQGTGTVLGSIDQKSQSIANSMAYMTDGLDDLINVNTEGFRGMQALVDSIGGTSSLLARDFDASGIASGLGLSGLGSITQDFGGIVDDFFGGLTGGLFESVFGGIGGALFGSSKVSDEGINLLSGTIAELIDNDVTQAYQTVTKKSLFSSSRKTSYRFAGDAIEQQFDLTLIAMRDAVKTSAESLRMLPDEVQANLDAFTIEAQKISIKGLSGDEIADELEAVFSSWLDGMSAAAAPIVTEFQRNGEGAGETLSRLSTNLSVVDEALSQLRLSELQGTTQEILTLSEGFVDFFGDASSLATAFTGFVGEFATQERQLEILTNSLTEALGGQDLAILSSRDGVYDYIASLQQLDGDNVERIANVLSLTDSLDDYFDLMEQYQGSLISGASDALSNLSDSLDAQRDLIRDSYTEQSEIISDSIDKTKESISELETVASMLESAISNTVSRSASAEVAALSSARQQIATFSDLGIIPDQDELSDLLSAVTGDNAKYYSSATDYYREQGRTANDIAFLSELADDQLTEAERTLQNQEEQLELLDEMKQNDLDALDAQYDFYRRQYDELTGINTGVLSVVDAIQALESALTNASTAQGSTSSEFDSFAQTIDQITSQNTINGQLDWQAAERQIARQALIQGLSTADVAQIMGISEERVRMAAERAGVAYIDGRNVGAYANGGVNSVGGMALVGERGPEIINMPAGTHTSNANDTKRMMNDPRILAALEAILAEEKLTKQYSKNSYDILNRVSNGGNSLNVDSVIVADITGA